MSSRPPGWPMRSSRSPTAAWTTCGRRTVEVSQAGRHVAGAATAEPVGPFTCARVRVFNPLLDGGMEIERLHAPVQVAPWHTLMGAVRRSRREERPSRRHRANFDWLFGGRWIPPTCTPPSTLHQVPHHPRLTSARSVKLFMTSRNMIASEA